jgi:hypothetical protein
MLKLSISFTRFELTIVVVHVGAVKIYVAGVEALRKKKTGGQNWMKLSLAPKKWCISEFHPPLGRLI